MQQETLKVSRRQALGTRESGRLRRQSLTPAVIYGHKEAVVHVAVPTEAFEHLLDEGARMLSLDVDGTAETVLVRDVQFDTFGDDLLHVDFVRIAMDEEIELEVTIDFHGTPVGVTEEGGIFEITSHNVLVACLPSSIPDELRVEVGHLGIGDAVHVSAVEVPDGVRIVTEPEIVLANVAAPTAIEEPEEELEAAEAVEGAVEGEAAAEEGEEEKESEA